MYNVGLRNANDIILQNTFFTTYGRLIKKGLKLQYKKQRIFDTFRENISILVLLARIDVELFCLLSRAKELEELRHTHAEVRFV